MLQMVGFVAVIRGFEGPADDDSESLGFINMGFRIGTSVTAEGMTFGLMIVVARLVDEAVEIGGVATVAELVIVCKVIFALTELVVGDSLFAISV